MWESLVTRHRNVFKQIFRTLALRHTKDQIKDDIRLPPQRRVVVTVPFTQIEEQHYSTIFGQMAEDCGLNLDGTPRIDDWNPNSPATVEKMRSWLIRLRQTCLHPEVGARNRRALGSGKGPLRTVGEVLEVMIEQNDIAVRLEERTVRKAPSDPLLKYSGAEGFMLPTVLCGPVLRLKSGYRFHLAKPC